MMNRFINVKSLVSKISIMQLDESEIVYISMAKEGH